MRKPLMRIPYTELLAPPTVRPSNANTIPGAVAALQNFFTAPPPKDLPRSTVVLTGAGLSVSSGLADYRGVNGTYRVNKTYRPIYYHEFLANHEARKRYWARSFLGWTSLHKASPNHGHYAIRDLGQLGLVRSVITQNVDSFHSKAHPDIPTLELHGYLRSTVCVTCRNEYPRDVFQDELARLNPAWAAFLVEALASGALDTENPAERKAKGIRTNPDGDLGGILKPAVVMFGESIAGEVKTAAEEAIDGAGRLLILGTSLATYSAWRLAKRALDRGMPIAIVNTGGVRGEDQISAVPDPDPTGALGVRTEVSTDVVLPALVERLQQMPRGGRA
ncbi:NAD-dependent protein deacylase SIR4 [Colletotrichum spaethianum]|uniref:NAD-dependent protein deacylase SIR4 n=1 Tax=Colletotrichum spaethianum TaxID=700344 RepID=A0AA37PHN8_9PEZI|nr:NAD-dependent protein deacylase SIR4 [Colletotrichum spaethianum]GKT52402.1 NAD-dependent protein deacylase SIR4 [Colletotrichum spaethianum]